MFSSPGDDVNGRKNKGGIDTPVDSPYRVGVLPIHFRTRREIYAKSRAREVPVLLRCPYSARFISGGKFMTAARALLHHDG